MKELVEMSDSTSLVEREDASAGLLPFVVAAVLDGENDNTYNVGAVFHMVKKTPVQVARNL